MFTQLFCDTKEGAVRRATSWLETRMDQSRWSISEEEAPAAAEQASARPGRLAKATGQSSEKLQNLYPWPMPGLQLFCARKINRNHFQI